MKSTQPTAHSILQNYPKNLPRYTSYPTAPHFTDNVDDAHTQSWIKEHPASGDLSLYFHIPYCRSICWYCGCNTKATKKDSVLDDYVDTLITEINMKSALVAKGAMVSHIHFGGGSPTILPAKLFTKLMDAIGAVFIVKNDAEIAIEVDPRELNESKIAAYAKAGVNRASLGVQDFDLKVQKAINRIQPFRVVHWAVSMLQTYGIQNINLDLIYGLPHQTEEIIKTNIEHALLMKPNRISLFGYAHVPWMKSHMKMIDDDSLPDAALRIKLFDLASDLLQQHGFTAVGLDHFVKSYDPMAIALKVKKLNRNFQGYTTDTAESLIGFGVSAISSTQKGYWQNHSDIRSYTRAVESGSLATAKGLSLSQEDTIRRRIIEQIMCYYSVDLNDYLDHSDRSNAILTMALESLYPLERAGFITIKGKVISIVSEARQMSRIVASAFDAYLQENPNQHAQVA